MPNSRPTPAQFPNEFAPPDTSIPLRGELILSGSLTPLPSSASPEQDHQDLQGVPAHPMPGFHHRKEVQLMLRRWKNRLSLWGRILSAPSQGSREARDRLLLPNHSMYIR